MPLTFLSCLQRNSLLYIFQLRRCILDSESAQFSAFWCNTGLDMNVFGEKGNIYYNFPFLISHSCPDLYHTKRLKVAHFHYLKCAFFISIFQVHGVVILLDFGEFGASHVYHWSRDTIQKASKTWQVMSDCMISE